MAFVEDRPGMPVSEQRTQALALGVPASKIYEIGKDGVEEFEHFVQAVRKGSTVYVAGYHVLGRNRAEMSDNMKQLQGKGAKLVDWNNADPAVALDQAYSRLHGLKRVLSSREARRRGKKGGKARWEGKKPVFTEEHEAMWKNVGKYPRDADAAAAVSRKLGEEITPAQLRYAFKSSGRPTGRRPAKKRKR